MNRMHLVAVAACSAALGIVACRSTDRVSETNTTSAPLPVAEPQPNADVPNVASVPVDDEARDGGQQSQVGHSGHAAYDTAGDEARDGGSSALSDFAAIKDAGRSAVDDANTSKNVHTKTGTKAKTNAGTGNVAPGHIMFPPDTPGRATGSPNSNGSHDVGAGGALVR